MEVGLLQQIQRALSTGGKVDIVISRSMVASEISRSDASTTTHASIVPVAVNEHLSVVGKNPIYKQIGATIRTGLIGTLKMPWKTAAVGAKAAEKAALTSDTTTPDHLLLEVGRFGAWKSFSDELFNTENGGLLDQEIADLMLAADRAFDAEVYAKAIAGATEVATVTDFSEEKFNLIMGATDVDFDGCFMMPRALFYANKGIAVEDGQADRIMRRAGANKGQTWEGDPIHFSTNFSGTQYLYGDMAQGLAIGEWKTPYKITINPFSEDKEGKTRITVAKLANVGVWNPEAISKSKIA